LNMHKIYEIILWNGEIIVLLSENCLIGLFLKTYHRYMGKKTKNILKAAGWVLLTPICLVLLLFVALYIPPVQKWAVDLAADYLSSETGMQVSVGSVRLKFPLNLSMGDVLIVSPPDTILDAKELLASVQAMPLLKGEVKVDYVTLTNTKVNTLDLIESMQMKFSAEQLAVSDVD